MKYDPQSETATIAGHQFKLKGYTRPNYNRIAEVEPVLNEKLQAGEIDRFEYYAEVLKLVLDGPVEHINADVIEGRVAEVIIENFIPESQRLMIRLRGFTQY